MLAANGNNHISGARPGSIPVVLRLVSWFSRRARGHEVYGAEILSKLPQKEPIQV